MSIKPKTKASSKLTRKEQRDLDIEISFLEGLVQRDPKFLEALQLLGTNYNRRGNLDQGLKIDRRLARLKPHDPTVLYNLACSFSLNNKVKQAADALSKSMDMGFKDYRLLMRDPDLANLRQDPIFGKLRNRLRPRASH